MSKVDVLIIGAGPVGVALACELARRDVRFRLVDRAPGPFQGSRGKTLQPRTLELMEDLGVLRSVLAHGEPTPAIRLYLPGGEEHVEHLFGDRQPTADTPYPRPFTIAQNLTEAALRRRLSELGGAIRYETQLMALEQEGDHVAVRLRTPAGDETVQADYVVGCDGGASTTRTLLDVPFDGDTDENRRLYVADVRLSGLDRHTWHSFQGPGGMLNFAPLATTDLYQCQASIPPEAPDQPTIEGLQAIVAERTGGDRVRLLDMCWSSAWRLNVRLAARYRQGRVFLAGDACHVHSPAGAQGLNTGFQDAYNLGWKLAAVLAGAPAVLLDSYEAERRPIAAWMLGLTSALEAQSFERKGFPTDRDEGSLQLGINYRDSVLSCERRAAPGRVRAGDRVPDAADLILDQQRVRLFDLLRGPRPVVLAFGTGWSGLLARLREQYGSNHLAAYAIGPEGEVLDPEGHAAASLGVEGDALLVIRPDKYLGFAADRDRADEVETYLQGIKG